MKEKKNSIYVRVTEKEKIRIENIVPNEAYRVLNI